jgi:hypothetical protein
MDILKRLIAAIVAISMIGGCASGGGGGSGNAGEVQYSQTPYGETGNTGSGNTGSGGGSTYRAKPEEQTLSPLVCILVLFFCPLFLNGSAPVAAGAVWVADSQPRAPVALTQWSDLRNQGATAPIIQAWGPQVVVRHERAADGAMGPVSVPAFEASATTTLEFGSYERSSDFIRNFESGGATLHASKFPLADHPAMEVLVTPGTAKRTAFADHDVIERVGVAANPHHAGWNYQSFGAWEADLDATGIAVRATSFGVATPAAAVPSSGAATFVGKLGGLYVSPAGRGSVAAADLAVNVDFSARSMGFASTNTVVMRAPSAPVAAPNLDLGGRLTYAPGSGTFSGTLSDADGTLRGASNGQFYGPAAQELGGVFALKSATTAEAFTGAYGAKR